MAEGALRQIFAEFGIWWDADPLEKGERQVTGMINHLNAFAGVIAGSAVLGAIREFADGFEEAAGQLQDTADVMGTTTTELQELQHAGVMAGLSTDRASAALSHLQQASADAARGAKGPGDAFRALGVHLKDADGNVRSTADLMDDLAVNFAHVEDPARRAQLAQDLFGRSGARMLNVLHEGAGGLAEVRAELGELGGGMFPEAIEAANGYGDAMDRNRVAMQSLRSVLAVELLPRLTDLVTRGTRAAAWLVRMTRDTNFAKTALYVLGVVGAAAGARFLVGWIPTIVRFGGMALVIGGLVLLFDDFLSLMRGGPSAIGDFVDASRGLGTSQRLVQSLKGSWEGVNLAITNAGSTLHRLWYEEEKSSADNLKTLTRIGDAYVAMTNVVGAFGERMFGGLRDKVMRFLGFLSNTIGGLAQRLGLTDLAEQLANSVRYGDAGPSTYADKNGRKLPGRVDRFAEASAGLDQFGRDHAGLQLVNEILSPRDVLHSMAAEWGDIFNGRNGALAMPPQAPAGGARATTHVTNTTSVGQVVVQGAGDPRRVADDVVRRIRQEGRNAADAAHPTNAHGSE